MSNEIHNLIISSIKRSENRVARACTRAEEIDTETIAQSITDKLTSLFKGGGMQVGGFQSDEDLAQEVEVEDSNFVLHLRAHLNEDTLLLDNFRGLAVSLSNLLALKLNTGQGSNARDGFLVTYYFTHTDDDEVVSHYLCVVFLHRIIGEDIDEDSLIFEEIERINLESLNLGAKICIEEFLLPTECRPISFKLGRASDVSRFFKNFLGCYEPINSREDTSALRLAIETSASSLGLNANQIERLCSNAKSFCLERLAGGDTSINLQALASYLFSDTEHASAFVEVAHESYRLGESVAIDKTELNKYTSFYGRTSDYSIKFNTNALNGDVDFNPDNNSLTFKNLPPNLLEQITSYLPEDG